MTLIPRDADIRILNAIDALRRVFYSSVLIEDVGVDYQNFAEAVNTVREIINKNLPCYINLSGGMRVLVIETLPAYTLLPPADQQEKRYTRYLWL